MPRPVPTHSAHVLIDVSIDRGVATVAIRNPPVNVLGPPLMMDLRRFLLGVREDPAMRLEAMLRTLEAERVGRPVPSSGRSL